MNRPAACSVTSIFTDNDSEAYTTDSEVLWLDDYPEPIASTIFELKKAFQKLQLTILKGKPNNLKEIGNCFDEFEFYLEYLIWKFKK
jgi:hypothetical protein